MCKQEQGNLQSIENDQPTVLEKLEEFIRRIQYPSKSFGYSNLYKEKKKKKKLGISKKNKNLPELEVVWDLILDEKFWLNAVNFKN